MLKIGVTGGIGSGKSTVCRVFQQLGIPVYSADLRARELMNTGKDLIKALKKDFGADIYDTTGQLNRPLLASRVFGDTAKVAKLNALVHPAVKDDFRKWASSQKGVPYVIKEAALMYESESYKGLDYVITVSAPKEIRIRRVMDRDNAKRADILKRMASQLSEQERLDRADFVIKNDGKHLLIPQVMELHGKFVAASGE
ncbi:MAG TPA: dephospho-CoA kinase [Bacteroidia bacterium]|nr:dephospho-CoA kinase [Bacteroidia bacterium]